MEVRLVSRRGSGVFFALVFARAEKREEGLLGRRCDSRMVGRGGRCSGRPVEKKVIVPGSERSVVSSVAGN